MWKYDIESEAEQVGRALTTTRNYSKRLQNPIGHVLDKIPILPAPKGARKAKEEVDSLVYGLISDRRSHQEREKLDNKRHDDLLSRLLQAYDSNLMGLASSHNARSSSSDDKMSDKQVRDEVMTIFIAGHETTAHALTWTFYLLSQYPDVEKKLHDEIDSVFGDINNGNGHVVNKVPTPEDIPRLQYTEKYSGNQ